MIVTGSVNGRGVRNGATLLGDARRERDRLEAEVWARALFGTADEWVVIDTETTGLDPGAEAVQIAVLSLAGETLMDTLVRPSGPIPWGASRVHGITDADVAGAPTYAELHDELARVLSRRGVVAYNAAFDERILQQTAARHGLRPPQSRWECAMRQYARWRNEWDERKQDYRWHKLPLLAAPGVRAHSAVGDCRSTLHVLRRMAGLEDLGASALEN
ncbi:MAG TPA: 3'-5' exonuclease [Chloroflexota bacterium]|nr:3'-5' exonuclease [Chloroflexota bacterium]